MGSRSSPTTTFPAAQVSAFTATKSVRMDAAAASEGLYVNGNRVIGPRQAAIANLAGGATLTDVINKINAILAMLRTHGEIAPYRTMATQ